VKISIMKDLLYIQIFKTNMKNTFSKLILFLLIINVCPVTAQQISPNLVGTNVWYNPGTTVWNLTAECGVQMIRIGGHQYDDNIPSKTTLLGWIKKIQAMGAEPIIQVSQYQSATVAADLVRYFNIEKSGEIAPVKYWNIGNEPWLQANKPSISTVGALVEAYFKPIAAAMKEVDPEIKIYGPDFCYYIDQAINDLFGGKNNIAGKVTDKDYYYCDGISWHLYPQEDNIDLAYQGLESFKSSIIKCKQKVAATNTALNRTGDDALTWGIGEFNAKGGPEVHTWGNGQMFGGILGLCMKYEAKYATSWSMFENGGNRQGTDFSFIDGANMTPRSSYRHMEFVAKYFKDNYIDGISSSSDFIVYGAQNEEQTAIMVMNRAGGPAKGYALLLNDTATSTEKYRLKVNAGLDVAYNDFISPRTTQVIIFKGDSITKINYSSDDFDNERPPSYSFFKLSDTLPETPENLQAAALSYKSIELTWNNNSANEMGYIIEREESNGFQMIAVLPADSKSYTNINLLPETSYTYRISAYNSLGKSDYSDIVSEVTLETPATKAFDGPHSIPGKIEAEDFNDNEAGIGYFDSDNVNQGGKYRTTGVDIETCTDAGGGHNIGYVQDGEWLNYLIDNVTPGVYDMAFRTASNTSGTKRIDVYLGDEKVGSVVPENTGGWQSWETLFLEDIDIQSADPIEMMLKFTGIEINLNWIEFIELNTSISNESAGNKVLAFYHRQTKNITVKAQRNMGKSVISVVNITGQSFYKSMLNGWDETDISTSNWAIGVYFLTVLNQNQKYTFKLKID
jgi:hypothetical protein